ncbi:hypothetical protein PtA15_10A221 [Puccinia triticina]|uniref:Uncharacterized protein n=1 Tax=Puccinia triticina TaxID=208348 RepID=A0ABY7CU75_9BASI|nr:uncharacterized protein PtA15_10A221 [Puccinia triticina]WAQ88801.1 hypothetical protein PtA15_10A221 [Puccinia triticina]
MIARCRKFDETDFMENPYVKGGPQKTWDPVMYRYQQLKNRGASSSGKPGGEINNQPKPTDRERTTTRLLTTG